jgi:hypothetical protein
MSEANEPKRPQDDDKPDASAYTEGSTPDPFSTVGATEDEEANRNQEVAPGFTDMEPGAGPDYGPSGEPGSAATEDPNRLTSPGFTAPEVAGETQKRPKPGEEWNEGDNTPATS